jgi:phosphoribosylformimino-5-aminoimidazole carboxamide ribonucleotide (ProFAR) isomerase
MVIVPALDVRGGRLARGGSTPVVERARELARDGASQLHLVDLDGAETGTFANLELLADAARASGVPCRLAGGISLVQHARDAFAKGFAGVLFSSAVFGDDDALREIARFGDRAIVEIEARAGFLEPRGGDAELVQIATGRGALASARAAAVAGIRGLYLIDVDADGALAGPPLALIDAVRTVVGAELQLHAGGGVRDLDDIRALAARGVASAVVGRALAERRFTIAEAKRAALPA